MGRRASTKADRVLNRYDVDAVTECWIWRGKPKDTGYGQVKVGGRSGRVLLAHKAMYELLVGPVPSGQVLDHTCRRKICVNPAHLEPVTQKINIHRGIAPSARAAAATACPAGHEYNELNTYVRPDGKGKMCRTCSRDRPRDREAERVRKECRVASCVRRAPPRGGTCALHAAVRRRFGTPEPVGMPGLVRQVPTAAETCMYKAFDECERLLYVGVTSNFTGRRSQHGRSDSQWFDRDVRWEFYWFATRATAETAESYAIVTEEPLFNRRGARRDSK